MTTPEATTFAGALKAAKEAAEKKDYLEVLNFCKKALTLYGSGGSGKEDPKLYPVYLLTGLAQNKLEKTELSESAYRKAIALNATNPLAWHGLFELFSRTGDQQKLAEPCSVLLSLIK